MGKYKCKYCGYKTEKPVMPSSCNYCGKSGSLAEVSDAEKLLEEM